MSASGSFLRKTISRAASSANTWTLYAYRDGRFMVMWNGEPLPYRVFDKDQRVTHAAITENKRLGAVLAYIKDQQDKAPPKPKVRTNSEKMGYQRNERKPGPKPQSKHKKKSKAS